MIPSVLASQHIKGTKDYLNTIFPSSTLAFFDIMDKFVSEEGKFFKDFCISAISDLFSNRDIFVCNNY